MRKVGGGNITLLAAGSQTNSSVTATDAFASDDLGLSSYKSSPDAEVSVRQFEEYTRDRLRVLHAIDRACAYESRLDNLETIKPKVQKELLASKLWLDYPSGLDSSSFLERKADFVRRDAVSHFALCLAFCKTRESRDWFVAQEQRLWVLRYGALKPQAQEAYIERSGLKCKKIDMKVASTDPSINHASIQHATPGARIFHGDRKAPEWDNTFYMMPFTEVDPGLVASRRVVILNGNAYVPSNALKSILAKKFKETLASTLDVAFQGLPVALAEPKIGGFLRDLQNYGMHLLIAPKSTSTNEDLGEALSLNNFEELMVRSFPPCMRRLVEQQRENKKHLKHAGRLQLRPFLKDCGFTIEDSHNWWKKELCWDPSITVTNFEKDYTYDIEHAYGKKGHLQGQNCFGCPKIIGFPDESAGQVHGCPFKTLDMPRLKQQMHKWKVPAQSVMDMEKLVNQGKHYQLACVEFFKGMHDGFEGPRVGNSPNDYFKDSSLYYKQKQEKEAANNKNAAS